MFKSVKKCLVTPFAIASIYVLPDYKICLKPYRCNVSKSHYSRIYRKEKSLEINFWSSEPLGFSNASGLQG